MGTFVMGVLGGFVGQLLVLVLIILAELAWGQYREDRGDEPT